MGSCCAPPMDPANVNTELRPPVEDSNGTLKDKSVVKGVKIAADAINETDEEKNELQKPRKNQKMVTKTQGELDKIAKSRDRGHRAGVSASVMATETIANFVKPVHPKTADEEKTLSEILQKNEKMKVICGSLEGADLKDVVNGFFQKMVTQGQDVIRQGEEGDLLYICEEGQLEIFVARPDPDTLEMPEGKGDKVLTVGPGALFGELALMYAAPRAATITVASSSAKLWALERDAFKMLLVSKSQKQFEAYQGYLKEVELLKPFNDHELSLIADIMESELYDTDDVVITQGDIGEGFFIVEDGTCEASIEGASGDVVVKSYEAGDYFGEIALLTDEPRRATVKATGQGATVLSISKEGFNNLLGPIAETLRKNIDRYPAYAEFLKK